MNWMEFVASVVAVIVALNLGIGALAAAFSKLASLTENKYDDKIARVLNKLAHWGMLVVVALKKAGLAKDKDKTSV